MLFFSSRTPLTMPKTAGIPKSLLADVNKVKSRLATLEKNHTSLAKTKLAAIEKAQASLAKELKDSMRSLNEAIRKQQDNIDSRIAQLGKMKPGMSMVDAVKAWKEREGGSSSSSMREPGQSWQSPTQQY